jgi:hypothetical protein
MGKQLELFEDTYSTPKETINIKQPDKYEECEWCFQFDDNEPQVFAWTDEDMGNDEPQVQFTISNNANSNITFTHTDGKVFKIFAREMTEKGREMQQKQKLFTNESKIKETTS